MNKKTLILLILSGIVLLIFAGILLYFQSFKTVYFDIKKQDIDVKIQRDRTEVGNFTNSGELRLPAGKYLATIQNDRYDQTPIAFEVVNKDLTITIDPSFSTSYLNQILDTEQAAINKKITDSYPAVISKFELKRGQLYKEGEWYATILIQKTAGRGDEPDIYRTVLKKEDGQWVIKAKPTIVLSAKVYPDIPFEILSTINRKGRF